MADALKDRIKKLKGSEQAGKCVIYVMSRDQRVRDNHALLCAQKHAIAKKLPLSVVFVLHDKVGVRAQEHYRFMLEGLSEVEEQLEKLHIPFMMLLGNPFERLTATFAHLKPEAVYFDFNPLREPVKLQEKIAKDATCKVFVVDTHNVIPVWVASDKKEVGAYTLRPKLHKKLADYLVEPEVLQTHPHAWPGEVKSLQELSVMIGEIVDTQPKNNTEIHFDSGELAARNHLMSFIEHKLELYAVDRNNPASGSQSDLSPYLHFGQISALRVALELQVVSHIHNSELHFLESPKMPKPEDAQTTMQHGIDSLIEEMIVRKELADNYCLHEQNYDTLEAAPQWAQKSLHAHREDLREHVYTQQELESAQTHDPAWNAAQRQLNRTGKMHGYMRMYWAKKVLEWSPIQPHNNSNLADFSDNFDMDGIAHTATRTKFPEEIYNSTHSERSKLLEKYFLQFYGAEWAIEVLKFLNDHYSIDGGDPNGYAGILWSVGGLHDRPWMEREIFGVVRYMNYGGLKRKFNIEAYEKQW